MIIWDALLAFHYIGNYSMVARSVHQARERQHHSNSLTSMRLEAKRDDISFDILLD
jgi:hypothetical protein